MPCQWLDKGVGLTYHICPVAATKAKGITACCQHGILFVRFVMQAVLFVYMVCVCVFVVCGWFTVLVSCSFFVACHWLKLLVTHCSVSASLRLRLWLKPS